MPEHQRRARARHRRQHEPHRMDQVGRRPQQHLALGQRLADQPQRAMLEIAQPAMDQLGRGRRGARAEVVLLQQQHAQAAAGGVARDAGAVDAAADDGEVVVGHEGLMIRASGQNARTARQSQAGMPVRSPIGLGGFQRFRVLDRPALRPSCRHRGPRRLGRCAMAGTMAPVSSWAKDDLWAETSGFEAIPGYIYEDHFICTVQIVFVR